MAHPTAFKITMMDMHVDTEEEVRHISQSLKNFVESIREMDTRYNKKILQAHDHR